MPGATITGPPLPQLRPPRRTGGAGGTGTVGPPGPAGPAGPGVAPGGTTGQVLTKSSAVDYATIWTTPSAGGALTVVGPTAPPSPAVGQLWWRTTDGNLYVWYDDGTSAQWVPAMATVGRVTTAQYYLVSGALAGVPTASLSLGLYVAALPFTFPSGLAGSQAVAKVAATAQTDVAVRQNGVAVGTVRWATGATVASFIMASATPVAAGDRLELVAPATPDATLSDPAWTLRGTL